MSVSFGFIEQQREKKQVPFSNGSSKFCNDRNVTNFDANSDTGNELVNYFSAIPGVGK